MGVSEVGRSSFHFLCKNEKPQLGFLAFSCAPQLGRFLGFAGRLGDPLQKCPSAGRVPVCSVCLSPPKRVSFKRRSRGFVSKANGFFVGFPSKSHLWVLVCSMLGFGEDGKLSISGDARSSPEYTALASKEQTRILFLKTVKEA